MTEQFIANVLNKTKMGCTGTKANKAEGDIDRYHQEIFAAAQTGDVKRLKDILDELDRRKASTTKKEVLNMGYREADGLTALSIAAGKKHKPLTEILASCPEVDVNKPSLSGITPLLMVAEVGWPDILDILLHRGAIVDSAPSGKRAEENKIAGSTPLIGATKYNHPECVKRLLEHHANPNHQNQSGISALMLAAEQGFFECVKLLVQAGADLELAPSGQLALTMNLCGQTPLFCAAKEGRTEIVKYLLDRGANPRVQNHYGVSALWIPAQKGMLQVVELLLNAGAETHVAPFGNLADELNITGWTPLYAAMKSRKFDVVKLLLKRGADPNAVTKLGSTPFLLASEICDLDIIEACVEAGADLDFAPSGPDADNLNITGQTALFMATLKDRVDVVKFLIQKGAHVNVQNRYGVSPLLLCAESGNYELVQALVQAGADVNITPQGELAEENFLAGQTPLFGAAKKGHVEICEYLIQNGADVNAVTMTGATPLYTATEEGHLDVVRLLNRHGADVNRSPKGQVARDLHIENQTPLLIACMRNHEAIIRHLIESGANVNVTSERGSSPFLAICQHNNVELARLLIQHGARHDVEAKNLYDGKINGLIVAAESGSFDTLRLLVEAARHDVEAKNLYDGKINGLIVAAESGSFDTLRLLVEAGLDVNYKIEGKGETAGRTPLFCACAKGFQDIVEYLIDRGADVNGTEKSGLSCLHIAAAMGHADTVRVLCERGANVDQQFRFEEQDVTAYDLAESQQHDHDIKIMYQRLCLFISHSFVNTIPTYRSIQTMNEVRKGLQSLVGAQLVFAYGDQHGSHARLTEDIKIDSTLASRTIPESYDEAIIPLASDVRLRERYANFENKVRFGRILEDLDTMAVHIAYKHNSPQLIKSINVHPLAIVTAAVDRIEVAIAHMHIDRDIRLSGFASFVGKSSMEATLKIDQDNNGTWEHVLHALFVLAARDPRTKKSAKMNPLVGLTEEDHTIIKEGELKRQRRLAEQDKSLFKIPPDTAESTIIHNLFLNTISP
ncbi:unnamed protein product, partial [Rotaria sordida]